MSERSTRKLVLDVLADRHATPVENRLAAPGTPDVATVDGWIELKQRAAWPKRGTTAVRVSRFARQQRRWLREHVEKGGRAVLVLRVGKEWLALRGDVAARIVGIATESQLREAALATWTTSNLDEGLHRCLCFNPPS